MPLTLSFGALSKCRASRALSESFSQDSDSDSKLFRTQLVCRFFYCCCFFSFISLSVQLHLSIVGLGAFHFQSSLSNLSSSTSFQPFKWLPEDELASGGLRCVLNPHNLHTMGHGFPLFRSDPIRSHPCLCLINGI